MKALITLTIIIISGTILPTEKTDFRPPGTVKIVDNFYFDAGEIQNIDWREYLSFLKVEYGEQSEKYKSNVPQENRIITEQNELPNEKILYFNNPKYDDHPVVNIPHARAKDYCKWRTKAVKIMLAENKVELNKDFLYRLPTMTEWELIAKAGYDEKQKRSLRKLRKKKKYNGALRTTNMIYEKSEIASAEYNSSTVPARTYLPNKYGVYNLYGNVSEMISEPGIAMGGSYIHHYEDVVPSNKTHTYNGPENWLGFRCVCEIIEK